MRLAFLISACLAVASCGAPINFVTTESYFEVPPSKRHATQVELLMHNPQRPYVVVASASVKEYKPGWSDPTVYDALDKIREVTVKAQGDAFIVRNSRSNGDRRVIVEGEVIRYRPEPSE
jgi:hypothetical protein